ncbi:MAG TPA: F-box protein [Parachlamydiaceae bacterium]|nr:F-box protein [Parachlamydiaceae bacterium]
MSLISDQSIGNSYIYQNVNEIKQDPIKILLDELVFLVFSHLNLATLGTICCVSKAWKRLANDPILWKIAIYREIAFGNDKWVQCFGTDVIKDEDNKEELFSLPSDDFIADCKKFKNTLPERNAKDSLMLVRLPKTLNGGLTLKSLGELAKKYFLKNDSGYRFIWTNIIQELGDKSIDKSHWVLMTKDVLPESKNKSYDEQQKIVADLAEKSLISYEVPKTLESITCILSQYFGSKIRLFSDSSYIYTRCQENVEGYQVAVGNFAPTGLYVYNFSFDSTNIGVAALRKF